MSAAPSKTPPVNLRKRVAKAHAASKDPGLERPARSSHAEHTIPPKKAAGSGPDASVLVGDCREVLPTIPEAAASKVDLIFADPPFNWSVPYDRWADSMTDAQYLDFTHAWTKACTDALRPGGALWINIPDDWAAEIVVYLKRTVGLELANWCIWHYRFGQNTRSRFISSKVHALYFVKPGGERTFNPIDIAEPSDRATTYGDKRTLSKRDGMPAGLRVPMDVWYGKFWGRIQGNNKERRARHHNQLPEIYLARVVRACSNPGDIVLDPFLGSGTTGVVAHALKRRFIGIEYSPENAASAAERIKKGPHRDPTAPFEGTPIFQTRRSLTIVADDEA
jgi:site-specific DNA-methyltransferase (adenine-specific)